MDSTELSTRGSNRAYLFNVVSCRKSWRCDAGMQLSGSKKLTWEVAESPFSSPESPLSTSLDTHGLAPGLHCGKSLVVGRWVSSPRSSGQGNDLSRKPAQAAGHLLTDRFFETISVARGWGSSGIEFLMNEDGHALDCGRVIELCEHVDGGG